MNKPFSGFDFSRFWNDHEYALREYVDVPPSGETVSLVEAELGYKLPAAYIALAQRHNGGYPTRTCHRMRERTSWAEDHIAITGIYSIGRARPCSLLGTFGSKFWQAEWGYPPIGVYFANCPSAGNDMLCLDYRECGPTGEPRVVHIDQEFDYQITRVADDFESFIRGLEPSEAFDSELSAGVAGDFHIPNSPFAT